MLYLCTETVTIPSRGPRNLANFSIEEIELSRLEKVVLKYHTYFFQAISYCFENKNPQVFWLSVDYLLRFEICREMVPPYRTVVSAQSERGEVRVRVGDLLDQRLSPCPAPLNPRRVDLATRHLLLTEIKCIKKTIYIYRPRTKYVGRLYFQFVCQSTGGEGTPVSGPRSLPEGYPSQDQYMGIPPPPGQDQDRVSPAPPPGQHQGRVPPPP